MLKKKKLTEQRRDLFKEGWKYITCYVTDIGKLCPMGEAKDKEYAIEIAKKHKHILCRLIKEGDYRKEKGEKMNIEKSKPYIELNYNSAGLLTGFNTWHRNNKKWLNITQVFENKGITYYTNGKKENK